MLIDSLAFTLEKSGCLDAFWGKLDAGEDAAVAFARNVAAYVGEERVLRFPERVDYPFDPKPADRRVIAQRMEAAWALNIPDAREACVTVCGTKGGAQQLPGDAPDSYQWRLVKAVYGQLVSVVPDGPEPLLWTGRKNGVDRALLMEMDSWLEDLEGGRPHAVRAEQAAAVVRVIEAMYESARQGRAICLT